MATTERASIPRDRDDDYSDSAREERLDFLREQTGVSLDHVAGEAIQPSEASGNIERWPSAGQRRARPGPVLRADGHR